MKQKINTDSNTRVTSEIINVDSVITSYEQQAYVNSTNTVILYLNQKQFNIDKNNIKSNDKNFSVTGQLYSKKEDKTNILLNK